MGMQVEKIVLIVLLGLAAVPAGMNLGTSMGDAIASNTHAELQISTPELTQRASAAMFSGLRALISPRVSFVRGADGLFREAASMGSSKFVNKARVSGEAVLRSDADVLRWLGESDYPSIEKVTFRREPLWFSPMVRRAKKTELDVTVPARYAGDETWLGQHLAGGLAQRHTQVNHSIPNSLFTKRESGNWITAGWASGALLGGAVGFVGGGPIGAALGGTLGASFSMFALPITREALIAFRLDSRVRKLAHSLRGQLSPGGTLTVKANSGTLDNLSVSVEPNSFPNRPPSSQTIQLEGLDATNIASEVQRIIQR